MLRQLVDSFIQSDLPKQEDEATSDIDDDNADSTKQTTPSIESGSGSARARAATLSDQSFGKVSVGVKLAEQQRVASFDIKTPKYSDGVRQSA